MTRIVIPQESQHALLLPVRKNSFTQYNHLLRYADRLSVPPLLRFLHESGMDVYLTGSVVSRALFSDFAHKYQDIDILAVQREPRKADALASTLEESIPQSTFIRGEPSKKPKEFTLNERLYIVSQPSMPRHLYAGMARRHLGLPPLVHHEYDFFFKPQLHGVEKDLDFAKIDLVVSEDADSLKKF